ncbi:MFS transporter [Pseudonocardia oceani]|uniref:MFS transporter n=1 Tax=Pseudonocardia oceani TaxID=2792013 RepID=A0ABS6UJE6_9PSEU|nr:MFS transporter [Pseudonocardia oceani]MBW0132013.1 MFS transporter [Pseudonocardia oceani]
MGSAATTALALVAGTDWQLGFVLFLVAITAYGVSIVVYYSYLPSWSVPTAATRSRPAAGRSAAPPPAPAGHRARRRRADGRLPPARRDAAPGPLGPADARVPGQLPARSVRRSSR